MSLGLTCLWLSGCKRNNLSNVLSFSLFFFLTSRWTQWPFLERLRDTDLLKEGQNGVRRGENYRHSWGLVWEHWFRYKKTLAWYLPLTEYFTKSGTMWRTWDDDRAFIKSSPEPYEIVPILQLKGLRIRVYLTTQVHSPNNWEGWIWIEGDLASEPILFTVLFPMWLLFPAGPFLWEDCTYPSSSRHVTGSVS